MKVALVCDWYHPRVGGIELHLQDLARRLTDAGNDVVVITATPGPDIVDGIRVRRVNATRAPWFGFVCTPAGIRAIGDAIRGENVDVAHCHVSIISPTAIGGALRSQRAQIPTVLTFHSVVPQTEALAHAARMMFGTRKWTARFSAVSERVARAVRPIAGGREITLLPNGIDAGFWRVAAGPRDVELRLLSVMRLNSKKRPLALVRIVRRLRALIPDIPVRLRIVGDGPLRERLARAVARAGLDDRIELLGRRSREEIRTLLSTTDVFVLPTVRESFGLAALEARCAGVPVVAVASSGVAEIIEHGREGLLGGSDEELALHVAALARDPRRREEIARHNRESTPAFDWPRVVDSHVRAYRDAIALRESI